MKNISNILIISFILIIINFNNTYAEELSKVTLSLNIDINKKLLEGTCIIAKQSEEDILINVKNIKLISVKSENKEIPFTIKDNKLKIPNSNFVEIRYLLELKTFTSNIASQEILGLRDNFITEDEIYLTSNWYPELKGVGLYDLKVNLPSGYNVISEADIIDKKSNGDKDEFLLKKDKPIDKINFFITKLNKYAEIYKDINIYLYSNILDKRRNNILNTIKSSIDFYSVYFGNLPNKNLNILETVSGYSFSSSGIILFNKDITQSKEKIEEYFVMNLLSQWFGGFVYVDESGGDWSKGLSLFLFGKYYKKPDKYFFKNLLLDYSNYINPVDEKPLKDFKDKDEVIFRNISYIKGAFVFNMLENILGKEYFIEGLRRLISQYAYKIASWNDLKKSFEAISNKNLNDYFEVWLNRKGAPLIDIQNASFIISEGMPSVTFDFVQKEQEFIFNIDLIIKTDKTQISRILEINKERQRFTIPVEGEPLELILDRDYKVFRRFTKEEYPVAISGFLGDTKKLIVKTNGHPESSEFIKLLNLNENKEKDEADITDEDITSHSLIIFLKEESFLLKRLFGDIEDIKTKDDCFDVIVKRNPLNPSKVIIIFSGNPKHISNDFIKDINQFRKFSFIRFKDGIALEKRFDERASGIQINIYKPIIVYQPKKSDKIDDVVDSLLDKPIIYIGERHTNYEDHKTQLKVIMKLHEKGRNFAIGMEMFQKPFQRFIDEYMSGLISEREFLKMTQYYKRWKYDYVHYRDIIEFAKSKKIPIIALNLWTEIVNKVASKGIDSLTFEERMEIPFDMDMSDESYSERLKEIFKQHNTKNETDFNNFYQAQILWDETMAHNIDEFLKKNPERQIVVLAGVGHLMYNSGIPKRTYRLNKREFVTLIPDIGDTNEAIANYVFFSEEIQPPETYKLGVMLKECNGYMKVEKIVPRSIAEYIGINIGDIIISIDDWKVEDIDDIKIAMIGKNRGDTIRVKLLRKGFLIGYKEIELKGTI